MQSVCFFFFNDTATTEIYTLSLHDALPISVEMVLSIGEQAHDRHVERKQRVQVDAVVSLRLQCRHGLPGPLLRRFHVCEDEDVGSLRNVPENSGNGSVGIVTDEFNVLSNEST